MNTNHVRLYVAVTVLLLAALACDFLPAMPAPTPFVYPTVDINQTLTAVVNAMLLTEIAEDMAQTQQASQYSPTPSPTSTETPTPSATPLPPTAVVVQVPVQVPIYVPVTVVPITVIVQPTTAAVPGPTARPGTSVLAPTLLAAPTIDGDLSDWFIGAYGVSNVVYGIGNWSGNADLSGNLYVGWNSAYLFIAATVNDDTYKQLASGAQMYKGDSVEILFDADVAGDFYTTTLNSDDYQLGLSCGQQPGMIPEAYLWYPSSRAGAATWAAVACDLIATGYRIEAAIPWAQLGVTPSVGKHYGFAFSISDNDTPATTQQETMVSNVATRRLTNPTTWGDLTLAP